MPPGDAGACRKWPLQGRSHFVCWNITRESLWLLCKVCKGPMPHDLADLKTWITAAVKNTDAPILMRVWQELEYHIEVCCVIHGAHIKHL
jgi:hypothetical protein